MQPKPRVKSPGLTRRSVGADGIQWFTRIQAGEFLKMSQQGVRYHQIRGKLRYRVVKGVYLFSRAVLEDFRANGNPRRDYLAVEAFKLLDVGCNPAQLVIRLKISPDLAREFARKHRQLSGFDIDSD